MKNNQAMARGNNINIFFYIYYLFKLFFLGIKDYCILFELRATHFPDSFLSNIMHLFFKGIAPTMLRHWQGNYFKNDYLNDNIYTIDKKIWNKIRKTMTLNSKNMPAEFGHSPIYISYYQAFKD